MKSHFSRISMPRNFSVNCILANSCGDTGWLNCDFLCDCDARHLLNTGLVLIQNSSPQFKPLLLTTLTVSNFLSIRGSRVPYCCLHFARITCSILLLAFWLYFANYRQLDNISKGVMYNVLANAYHTEKCFWSSNWFDTDSQASSFSVNKFHTV